MTYKEIDLIFPFFVFGYGAVMTIVLNMPKLIEAAEERLPQAIVKQIQGHRHLGFVCLIVGSLWSLQNLLID